MIKVHLMYLRKMPGILEIKLAQVQKKLNLKKLIDIQATLIVEAFENILAQWQSIRYGEYTCCEILLSG